MVDCFIFEVYVWLDTPRRLAQVTVFSAHLEHTKILLVTIGVRAVLLGCTAHWREKLMTPTVSTVWELSWITSVVGLNEVCQTQLKLVFKIDFLQSVI